IYTQEYERGNPLQDLQEGGETNEKGTEISFKPDLTIFSDIVDFDFEQINTRLRRTAFLNAGLEIKFHDARKEDSEIIQHKYDGGLKEYVEWMNANRESLHSEPVHIIGSRVGDKGEVHVEVALQWTSAYSES
ncbi:MAG: hypothetical protein VW270_30415, partial [Candidatus Poseidoniales archaeon]